MVSLVHLPTCERVVCATACIPADEGVRTGVDVCVYVGEALAQDLNFLVVRPHSYVCCLGLVQVSCAQRKIISQDSNMIPIGKGWYDQRTPSVTRVLYPWGAG